MPSRGQYAKGAAKLEEILEVALDEYEKNGFDRTSFREVARRSGLTQAGLLHYFPTKESLFIELLRRRDERWAAGTQSPSQRHSVAQLIEAVEHNEDEAGLVRLFVNLSAESTVRAGASRNFFAQRYSWLRSEITADIERAQSSGEFTARYEAGDIAALLIAAADGLQLQWLLSPDTVPMGDELRRLWQMLKDLDNAPVDWARQTGTSVSSPRDSVSPPSVD